MQFFNYEIQWRLVVKYQLVSVFTMISNEWNGTVCDVLLRTSLNYWKVVSVLSWFSGVRNQAQL